MSVIPPDVFYRYFSSQWSGYNSLCGICQKEGAEARWLSPVSKCAHAKCVKLISPAESPLTTTLDTLFKKPREYQKAHSVAVRAVQKKIGKDSILTHFERQGTETLAKLFATVGVEAAKDYANRLAKL